MIAKSYLWIGAMAFVITISVAVKGEDAGASALKATYASIQEASQAMEDAASQDRFLQALGGVKDHEVFDALYGGDSLADIAAANNADVQNVIDLQIAELTAQLDQRLAAGSLSPDNYEAQKSEIAEVVTRSAYARNG